MLCAFVRDINVRQTEMCGKLGANDDEFATDKMFHSFA